MIPNPLIKDGKETRRRLIRISTYVANNGGIDFCVNKCPSKNVVRWSNKSNGEQQKGMRCCSSCNKDYLTEPQRKIVKDELGITPTELGYWGEQGCRLPRSHRPHFCLSFYCFPARKAIFGTEDINFLDNARHGGLLFEQEKLISET